MTADCSTTIGNTIGLLIQGHVDFSSELCNAHEHISMHKEEQYVTADINISDNYLLTYILTPWCTVLLEKLPVLQLVKKFPAFHGT